MTDYPKIDGLGHVSRGDKEKIKSILQTLDPDMVRDWHEQLRVDGEHLLGTDYRRLGDALSFNQFTDLYQALGYPLAEWQNYICDTASHACTECFGQTCNPVACGKS